MYSWEMDKIIKEYNYLIPSNVYMQLADTTKNPQIAYVHYNAWKEEYTIITLDNYKWTFKIRKGET